MSLCFRIAPDEQGRVDRAVARRYPLVGRRALARMFRAGRIRVQGAVVKKGDQVSAGVEVHLDFEPGSTVVPFENPQLVSVHEDESLIAIGKLAGMPSHPLAPHETNTVANVIVARFPECASASDDPRGSWARSSA